jgi:hypothetical protein
MKRHITIPMAMIILVSALAVNAQAQSAGSQRVVANIPFALSVGEKNLPAGKYTITVLNPTSDRKILQIRSKDGRSSAMTLTTGVIGNASDDTKLVFHRYGSRYFFAQAQMAGDAMGLAAVKSNAERAQRDAVAKAEKKTVVIVVAE